MGDVVNLQPAHLEDNHEFVADCCRYQEGILSEANMKRKYGFADNVWTSLGDDTALLAAVEDEKIRRERTGQQKREQSQHLSTKAPAILDTIMSDVSANPRHRVDAIKTLDGFAANGPENAPASDRFVISIFLGSDLDGKPIVEKYDKPFAIDPDPNGIKPVADQASGRRRLPGRDRATNKLKGDDDGGII